MVIAVGGKFVASAWVALSILRRVHGCTLPIELWHLGEADLPADLRRSFGRFDVTFVDAIKHAGSSNWQPKSGWELKPYAVANSRFAEVLLLDADNVPLKDPAYLFEDSRYRARGAAFWPDVRAVNPFNPIWTIAGVTPPKGQEFDSGQLLIDKRRHWSGVELALFFNRHSDFYYRYLMGDKETFHLAWRMLKARYALPGRVPNHAFGHIPFQENEADVLVGLWQHDFDGDPSFLHFTDIPFTAWGRNPVCPGFDLRHAAELALEELRQAWNGYLLPRPTPVTIARTAAEIAAHGIFFYTRLGLDQRRLALLPGGRIGEGAADAECFWHVDEDAEGPVLTISGRTDGTCRLRMQQDGSWRGAWLRFEQSPAELVPVSASGRGDGDTRSDSRSRLLFVTPVVPNDRGNGLAMRAGNVLRQLTETHRVSLLIVPLYSVGASKRMPGWIENRCEQIRWARPPQQGQFSISDDDAPHVQRRQADEAWAEAAGRAYCDSRFDTIHVFRLAAVRFALPYLTRQQHASARWHLDLDDVESRSSRRLAALYERHGHEDERRAAIQSAMVADHAEQQVLTTWDRVYVCSSDDHDYLEQRAPGHRAEIAVLPNRVALPANPPPARRSSPMTLLYVGSFNYFPNTDGAIWFCREVLPAMRELSPLRFRVLLVGTGAPREVRDLANISEVEFVGEVESIEEWYQQADAVVVPVRAGGGTRIKLLEALAHRRPVVATSLAAEGLELTAGEHLLVANRQMPFARHCLRLLEDDHLADRLAIQGRQAVEQRYGISWPGTASFVRS